MNSQLTPDTIHQQLIVFRETACEAASEMQDAAGRVWSAMQSHSLEDLNFWLDVLNEAHRKTKLHSSKVRSILRQIIEQEADL